MARRIVQVVASSSADTERHVRDVAAQLAADGCAVMVVAAKDADVVADERVRHVPANLTDRLPAADAGVVRTVRRLARGADVVHAHGLRAGAAAVAAVRSLRGCKPAVVVTLHDLPTGPAGMRGVSAVLERAVARGADVCLGVSSDLVERVRGHGAEHTARALVAAPSRQTAGRRADEVRSGLKVADGTLVVLTVAALVAHKGLGLLVDAAATMFDPARPDRFRWLVAGDGPLHDELDIQVARTGAPVTLLGPRDDTADLMATCDVFCSTSQWEGQSVPVQQALAAGVPVVATDVGGTAEVTGDAAVLVPYDADLLAEALTGLLDSADERQARSQASAAQAAHLPTDEDVLAQLTEVYTTLPSRADRPCSPEPADPA
ncbi:MAG: glycosyltransferase family 4 protein [Micrococcales bacterium]|nr:glycosyltransferase family 4 protein [Micrococcales bacterium]MCL2667479.1 glycosyltransferase family 4 protein [Micrococcales bacterium]